MFLYSKEKAIPSKLCKDFIREFESSNEKHPGISYNKDKGHYLSNDIKKSTDLSFDPSFLNDPTWSPLLVPLVNILHKELANYELRYEKGIHNIEPIRLFEYFNLQRYLPEEGFYQYHCERAGWKYLPRVLVWMVYLNDVTDRGETEFYYQQHYETPKEGKIIIWPSDWTYLHRGVASPTQTKYILTGWFSHFKEQNYE